MKRPVDEQFGIMQGFGKTDFTEKNGQQIYYVFGGNHPGIDYDTPVGTPIYAALPGWVTEIEYHRGMGKTIRMRYGNIQVIYGHLDKFIVEPGDWVEEGQQIALSGNSVTWTLPHLHFEMRNRLEENLAKRPINPDFSLEVPKEFVPEWEFTFNDKYALIDLAIKFYGGEQGVEILKSKNKIFDEIAKDNYPDQHNIYFPIGTKAIIPLK